VEREILELTVRALLGEVKFTSITCQVSLAILHAVTWGQDIFSHGWHQESQYLLISGRPQPEF
jgi:hypothetical protein